MKYVILRNGSRLRVPDNGGAALLKVLRAKGMLAPDENAGKTIAKPAKAPKPAAPVVQAETVQESGSAPIAPVPAKRAAKSRTKSSE